jgi:hypothetical protein
LQKKVKDSASTTLAIHKLRARLYRLEHPAATGAAGPAFFDVVVRLTNFPLESANFVFIFAFQGGIIHQLSQLFLRLIHHFVKLALDPNFGT